MSGKHDVVKETRTCNKIATDEGKDKVGILQNSSGKILIEVNVSKQNMHDREITQIIREIFELNNRDLEVEKVVMPIGENTWQIRRTNHSDIKDAGSVESLTCVAQDRRKTRLKQNRMKVVKHNGLCKVKMLQSLNRSRQNSRRKMTRKHSEMMGLNKLDVAEVHSSPAITNLLSQLYPNPYNLLNLLEIQDKSIDTQYMLDASDSGKIKFKAVNVVSVKDGLAKQEMNSPTKSSAGTASETAQKPGDNKMEAKSVVDRNERTPNELFDSSVAAAPEKEISPKLKRKVAAEPVLATSNKSEHMKTGGGKLMEREVTSTINDIRQRSKMTTTESKFPKKRITKTSSATTEKLAGEKANGIKRRISPTREKVSISTIHPLSLQKTVCSFEDKGDREKFSEQEKSSPSDKKFYKGKKRFLSEKNKCVVKYLKLIKDLYEEEEKHLQNQIVNARNFAIDQIEKPDKKEDKLRCPRKSKQSAPNGGMWKNCQSQIARIKPPKSLDKDKGGLVYTADLVELSTDEHIHSKKGQLLSAVINTPAQSCCPRLTRRIENPDSINKNMQNFDSCNQSRCDINRIIHTETYVLNKRNNIEKTSEGLPINVLNTVHETNRKIDLLIRQIDNSMNWLSQSQKTDPGSIACAIDRAKDLPEVWELERNLKRPTPESRNFSCKRNDLLLGQSFHSLHIFPIDNGVGGFRISADSLFNMRNQEYPWPGIFRPNSFNNFLAKSNKLLLPNHSDNFIKSTISGTDRYRSREEEHSQKSVISQRNFSLDTQIPKHTLASSSILISVESSNELGSFDENSDQREIESNDSLKFSRNRDSSKVSLAEVKSALDNGQFILNNSKSFVIESAKSLASSLSINAVALDESVSNLKPVIIQEITWNFYLPAPLPVTHVLYRNERSLVFTTMEANVLHVARTTSFLNLALMNVVQIIDQEPKQQSSIIISLHKCSSFIKNNEGLHESGKACKFVVLPSDIRFAEQSSGNIALSDEDIAEIKVLKKAETGGRKENCEDQPPDWNCFPSESSTEMFDGKAGIKRIEALLRRTSKSRLTWLHPLPDPYESNPDTNHADSSEPMNFHAIRTSPNRDEEVLFPKMYGWDRGNVKFDSVAPPIFRYLSSETSNTSLDDKKPEDIKKISNTKIPIFPDIKKSLENTGRQEVPPKELRTADRPEMHPPDQDDNDSSSTSSFKSSNDCSDISEVFELNLPKKRSKRTHFLDMLFHELRSFRKSLSKRKGPKRKTVQEEQKDSNEFQDALSELNLDDKGGDEKQKVDEVRTTVNTTCIDEIAIPASYAIPRKIFKTSFRGKESVTELMIDLKDVSISEVSDISVEKRKLSTDHTKISIVISKHGDKVCCANGGTKPPDSELQSPKASYHSLKPEKTNCIGWRKNDGDTSDEDVDDEDFKSVDSGNSVENIPINKSEDYVRIVNEPRKECTPYEKHKFDFYKKMENATSSFFTSKYGKELSPLRKAITDMQVRVRNIQRNSFCTSDEYYERALRMAKMSAGYCQSCKSKTVIPEDPLGIYQKFIPRSCTRGPYGKHRKYYFKTTSSTNSSFYSIHSSNSDISNKFCHLNSSSSMVPNGLHRSRGPVLRGSVDSTLPFFLGRTINF